MATGKAGVASKILKAGGGKGVAFLKAFGVGARMGIEEAANQRLLGSGLAKVFQRGMESAAYETNSAGALGAAMYAEAHPYKTSAAIAYAGYAGYSALTPGDNAFVPFF